MRKLFLLLLLLPFVSHSQNGYFICGASQAAMGNAGITSKDAFSLFHNPSGIAFLSSTGAGITYENKYNLKNLSTSAFAVGIPVKNGAIGVNGAYFGQKIYNEQQAGLTYSRKFSERIAAGVRLIYHSVNLPEEYGSKAVLTFAAGMQGSITKKLWLGAHIYNPIQAELVSESGEELPSVFSAGAGFTFSDQFRIELMTEKNSRNKAFVRTGVEYHPVKQFWVRAGLSSDPMITTFGFGADLKGFMLDVAAYVHPQLGITPVIGLSYRFEKNKE